MSHKAIKFEKITLYDSLIRDFTFGVDNSLHGSSISFRGTPKIHGCNCSVVLHPKDREFTCQSRNRMIKNDEDHFEFRETQQTKNKDFWNQMKVILANTYGEDKTFVVFGEWAGTGIMKKVAIGVLPKRFIVFDIYIVDEHGETVPKKYGTPYWSEIIELRDLFSLADTTDSAPVKVFCIHDFKSYFIKFDLLEIDRIKSKIDDLSHNVGEFCPIAEKFGVFGRGEGIVWTGSILGQSMETRKACVHTYAFKTKHKRFFKVSKPPRPKSPVDQDKFDAANVFAGQVLLEERLEQGLEYLIEHQMENGMKSFKFFLSWVIKDIMIEEKHRMKDEGIDSKVVGKILPSMIKTWYMEKLKI